MRELRLALSPPEFYLVITPYLGIPFAKGLLLTSSPEKAGIEHIYRALPERYPPGKARALVGRGVDGYLLSDRWSEREAEPH